jgi:pimeloyl-ACP methyl ester carboxylesterase
MSEIRLSRGQDTLVGTAIGEGPTALLLHAGGEHRGVWDSIAQTLAASGFRSVAYDLRGHGASASSGAQLLQTHADDVAAMIGAEASPPTVVGASLGGLAATLALAQLEVRRRVAGLVLVDAAPTIAPARAKAYLNEVSDGLGDSPRVSDVLGHVGQLCAAARELDGVPVTLVRGGRSPVTDADAVERFLELVPHAKVEVIARAGHLIARDTPPELAKVLIGQLEMRLR